MTRFDVLYEKVVEEAGILSGLMKAAGSIAKPIAGAAGKVIGGAAKGIVDPTRLKPTNLVKNAGNFAKDTAIGAAKGIGIATGNISKGMSGSMGNLNARKQLHNAKISFERDYIGQNNRPKFTINLRKNKPSNNKSLTMYATISNDNDWNNKMVLYDKDKGVFFFPSKKSLPNPDNTMEFTK